MTRNNSYIRRETNKGQENISVYSDISKELSEGSVMNFDGTLYANAGSSIGDAAGSITNFDIRIKMHMPDPLGDAAARGGAFLHFGNLDDSYGLLTVRISSLRQFDVLTNGTNPTLRLNAETYDYDVEVDILIQKRGSDYELFFNGVSVDTGTDASGLDATGLDFVIGKYYYSGAGGECNNTIYEIIGEFDGDELLKFTGSETAGNIWHNAAADAPADSDAVINLNGASDGDQFTTSIYASDHNVKYGRRQVGGFDANLYHDIGNRSISEFQIQEFEWEYVCIISGGANRYFANLQFDAVNANGMQMFFDNVSTRVRLRTYNGITYDQVSTQPISTSEQKNAIKINFKGYNGTLYSFYNDVFKNQVAYSTITYGNDFHTAIGAIYSGGYVGQYAGMIYYMKFWSLDNSGNRVLLLGEWDFSNMENGVVPNTATNAPANSDAILNLNGSYSGREKVYIPQKTGILDVYGQPIDNTKQVDRYRRMINY